MGLYDRFSGFDNVDTSNVSQALKRAQAAPAYTPPPPPPPEDTGIVRGTFKALGRGIAGIGEQAGQAMEWNPDYQMTIQPGQATGDESKLSTINRLGRSLKEASGSIKDSIGEPIAKGFAKKAWFGGIEALPVSAAYAIPSYVGATVGAGLGVVDSGGVASIPQAIAGAAAGQAVSAPIMYRAAAQEHADTLRKLNPNVENQKLLDSAVKAGHAEWMGEAISDIPEAVIFSRLPGFKGVIKSVREGIKPTAKQLGKNMLATQAAEQLGENYTTWQQTNALNSALPQDKQIPMEQALLDTVGSTAVLSGLMGLGGTGVQYARGHMIEKALSNPAANPEKRGEAAGTVYNALHDAEKEGTAPAGSADNFLRHALDAIGDVEHTGTAPYALDLSDPRLIAPYTQPDTDVQTPGSSSRETANAPAGQEAAPVQPGAAVLQDNIPDFSSVGAQTLPGHIISSPSQVPAPTGVLGRAIATVMPDMSIPEVRPAMPEVQRQGIAGPIIDAEYSEVRPALPAPPSEMEKARVWATDQIRNGKSYLMQNRGISDEQHDARILAEYRKAQGGTNGAQNNLSALQSPATVDGLGISVPQLQTENDGQRGTNPQSGGLTNDLSQMRQETSPAQEVSRMRGEDVGSRQTQETGRTQSSPLPEPLQQIHSAISTMQPGYVLEHLAKSPEVVDQLVAAGVVEPSRSLIKQTQQAIAWSKSVSDHATPVGAGSKPAPVQPAPTATTLASLKSNRRALDSSKDSLLVAIAKLGGIKRADIDSQVSDPKGLALGVNKIAGKESKQFMHVIHQKGIPLDSMREALVEQGYLPHHADINTLLDRLDDSSRGTVYRSAEGDHTTAAEDTYQAEAQRHADMIAGMDEKEYAEYTRNQWLEEQADLLAYADDVLDDYLALFDDADMTAADWQKVQQDFEEALNGEISDNSTGRGEHDQREVQEPATQTETGVSELGQGDITKEDTTGADKEKLKGGTSKPQFKGAKPFEGDPKNLVVGDEYRATAAQAQQIADTYGDGAIHRVTDRNRFSSGTDSGNVEYGHKVKYQKVPVRGVTSFVAGDPSDIINVKVNGQENSGEMLHYAVKPSEVGGEFLVVRKDADTVYLYANNVVDTSTVKVHSHGARLEAQAQEIAKDREEEVHVLETIQNTDDELNRLGVEIIDRNKETESEGDAGTSGKSGSAKKINSGETGENKSLDQINQIPRQRAGGETQFPASKPEPTLVNPDEKESSQPAPRERTSDHKSKHQQNLEKMLANAKTEQGKANWKKRLEALKEKEKSVASPANSSRMVNEESQKQETPTNDEIRGNVENAAAVRESGGTGTSATGGTSGRSASGRTGNVQPAGKRTDTADDQRSSRKPVVSGTGATAEPGGNDRTGSGNKRHDGVLEVMPLNYRITPADNLGKGSAKQKARDNIAAIKLLKQITSEERGATPEEQAQLVKYVGWGASELANGIFVNTGYNPATRKHEAAWFKDGWEDQGRELMSLLSPEEYAAAKKSTMNAHYTPSSIIEGMYNALEQMGFSGGRMLEPGSGIGHFIGLLPEKFLATTRFSGVEMDNTSAAIAKLLYPGHDIRHQGFEKFTMPNGFYDVAIGNPPFLDLDVTSDPDYARHKFKLHDFFFAKAIDKVRPGGLLMFVTSKGTMDKANDKARSYISERADLLGALRMPQSAFSENAGTETVTDVLFLQKRAADVEATGKTWGELKEIQTPEGPAHINEYFADHPEMVLGENRIESSQFGPKYTVIPVKDGNLADQFFRAVNQYLPKDIYTREKTESPADRPTVEFDLAPSNVKEGAFFLDKSGNVLSKESGVGVPIKKNSKDLEVIKSFIPLRDAVRQVLYVQIKGGDLHAAQKDLKKQYEAFVKKHGVINSEKRIVTMRGEKESVSVRTPNFSPFRDDPDAYLVASIERYNDVTNSATPGPIFTERTIKPEVIPQINSVHDALHVVMHEDGVIDIAKIAAHMNVTEAQAIDALGAAIYHNPQTAQWETDDEYLSGNVKQKLAVAESAAQADPVFSRNVEALKAVQPTDLPPSRISLGLGEPILKPEHIQQFANEVINLGIKVSHLKATGDWSVEKVSGYQTTEATSDWGTVRRDAAELINAALNSNQLRIESYEMRDGKEVKVFDKDATNAANEKLAKIKERFAQWVWEHPGRSEELTRAFNDAYNTNVKRVYGGEHISKMTFPGMSAVVTPHEHQKRVAWRIVQSGNTYMAHSVGAGKTIASILGGMELKRLGIKKKPSYVVPNHMLKQFASEFLQLYPAAKIIVADENQFSKENRNRFMGRVAAENWDAVIITHSAFGKMQVSPEFSSQFIQEQIDELEWALSEVDNGDRLKRKQIERAKARLEQRLEKVLSATDKDKGVTFEETGIDQIFVDEAHEFRKLDFVTNQTNIKGIDPNGSLMSFDLYVKSRYLEKLYPNRSLVLMSGTAITNTIGEIFTIQRFLQESKLRELGLDNFDAWSSTFGDLVTKLEATPAGNYKPVTRFAKFKKLSSLSQLWSEVGDFIHAKDLTYIKRPAVKTGGRIIVTGELSAAQKAYKQTLADRIKSIEKRKGPPKKGDDILLSVITDGRHAALDERYISSGRPSKDNKLEKMVSNVFQIWSDTKKDKLTQMVFCDLGMPGSEERRGFSAYNQIKDSLIKQGIPAAEIAFMQDYKKSDEKIKLFRAMNEGKVRVLIGSSEAMGTGVNAQRLLVALHHLDPDTYLPSNIEQREGRIVRQGNTNKEIQLYTYVTKGSYDETMWQFLETKQRFIDDFLSGETTVDEATDVDGSADSFAMARAMSSDNPLILERAGIESDIQRLESLRRAYFDDQQRLRSNVSRAEDNLPHYRKEMVALDKVIARRVDTAGDKFALTIGSREYDERKKAGEVLTKAIDKLLTSGKAQDWHKVGEVAGLDIMARSAFDLKVPFAQLSVGATGTYSNPLGFTGLESTEDLDAVGLAMKLENMARSFDKHLATMQENAARDEKLLQDSKERVGRPFEHAQALEEKRTRLNEIETILRAEETAAPEKTEKYSPRSATNGLNLKFHITEDPKLTAAAETLEDHFRVNGNKTQQFFAVDDGEDARAVERIGKALGKQVIFVRSMPGNSIAFNGVVIDNKTIYLDADAVRPHLTVFGHELLHVVKMDDTKLYNRFVSQVMGMVKGVPEYADRLNALREQNNMKPLDRDTMLEELVADFVGDRMTEKEFWDEVKQQSPSVFGRILKALQRLLNKVLVRSAAEHDQFVTDVRALRRAVVDMLSEYAGMQQGVIARDMRTDAAYAAAWHGSPHDHDQFSMDKIGTGEGNQTYGYGLYFSGNKEVAEHYQQTLAGDPMRIPFQQILKEEFPDRTFTMSESSDIFAGVLQKDVTGKILQNRNRSLRDLDTNKLDKVISRSLAATKGRLYQVELAPQEDEYLLYDKPLSDQSKEIQKVLPGIKEALGEDYISDVEDRLNADFDEWSGNELYKVLTNYASESPLPGQEDTSGNLKQDVSEYLHSLGIRGIKYLDGSSRSAGEGNHNYVIFDDKDVSIKEKYSLKQQDQFIAQHAEKIDAPGKVSTMTKQLFEIAGQHMPQRLKATLGKFLSNPWFGSEGKPIRRMVVNLNIERSQNRNEIISDLFAKSEGYEGVEGLHNLLKNASKAELKQFNDLIKYGDRNDVAKTFTRDELYRGKTPFGKLSRTVVESYKAFQQIIQATNRVRFDKLSEIALLPYKNETWYPELLDLLEHRYNLERDLGSADEVGRLNKLLSSTRRRMSDAELFSDNNPTEKPVTKAVADAYKKFMDKLEVVSEPGLVRMAYKSITEYRSELEKIRNEWGQVKGYAPRIRKDGDWHVSVYVTNEDGERTKVYMKPTITEAGAQSEVAKIRKDLKGYLKDNYTDGAQYEVEYARNTATPSELLADRGKELAIEQLIMSAFDKANVFKTSAEDLAAMKRAVLDGVAKEIMAQGFSRHGISREKTMIEGYKDDDYVSVIKEFISGMAGWLAKMQYAVEVNREAERISNGNPDDKVWVHSYFKDSMKISNYMDELAATARSVGAVYYLGFKISSAVLNAFQNYTVGQAVLAGMMKKAGRKGEPILMLAKAQRDMVAHAMGKGNLTEEEIQVLHQAVRQGTAHAQTVRSLSGLQEQGFGSKWKKFVEIGMTPFSWVEQYANREPGVLAAYRAFKSTPAGEFDAAAFTKAEEFTANAHFLMGSENLPELVRNLGAAGKMLYLFQGYTHNYMLMMANALKNGEFNVIARSLGTIAALGGVFALPGADDLDKWITKWFGVSYKLKFKHWMRQHAKEYGTPGEAIEAFVNYGAPSVAGIDMSKAIGVNIPFVSDPDKTFGESLSGVWGGMAKKPVMAAQALGSGQYYRAIESMVPEFAANPMRAYRQATTGATTLSGKPILDETGHQMQYSGVDVAKKVMGFNPSDVSERTELKGVERDLTTTWNDERKDRLAALRVAKTQEEVRQAVQDVIKWNRSLFQSQAKGLVSPIKASSIQRARQFKPAGSDRKRMAWEKDFID